MRKKMLIFSKMQYIHLKMNRNAQRRRVETTSWWRTKSKPFSEMLYRCLLYGKLSFLVIIRPISLSYNLLGVCLKPLFPHPHFG